MRLKERGSLHLPLCHRFKSSPLSPSSAAGWQQLLLFLSPAYLENRRYLPWDIARGTERVTRRSLCKRGLVNPQAKCLSGLASCPGPDPKHRFPRSSPGAPSWDRLASGSSRRKQRGALTPTCVSTSSQVPGSHLAWSDAVRNGPTNPASGKTRAHRPVAGDLSALGEEETARQQGPRCPCVVPSSGYSHQQRPGPEPRSLKPRVGKHGGNRLGGGTDVEEERAPGAVGTAAFLQGRGPAVGRHLRTGRGGDQGTHT